MNVLQRVAGLTLRDRMRGAQSRVTAPPHPNEPVEVVWASALDAYRMPPKGVVFRHVGLRRSLGANLGLAGETISPSRLRDCFGVPQELEGMDAEMEDWRSLLRLLACDQSWITNGKIKEWIEGLMDGWTIPLLGIIEHYATAMVFLLCCYFCEIWQWYTGIYMFPQKVMPWCFLKTIFFLFCVSDDFPMWRPEVMKVLTAQTNVRQCKTDDKSCLWSEQSSPCMNVALSAITGLLAVSPPAEGKNGRYTPASMKISSNQSVRDTDMKYSYTWTWYEFNAPAVTSSVPK